MVRMNGEGRPVASFDIDGTLGDYHGHFLRFAEGYLGRELPAPGAINPGLPLWKHMGISRQLYRNVKLAYRQGGLKRSMPCLPGAAEVLAEIRQHAEVWICTTRPYLRLDNIDPDTREWLGRNKIRYDALLFDPAGGDYKYRELHRQAGRRVACVAEDLPEQAMIALRLGFRPVLLRNQPYNHTLGTVKVSGRKMSFRDEDPINTWDTAEQLRDLVWKAIDDWEG